MKPAIRTTLALAGTLVLAATLTGCYPAIVSGPVIDRDHDQARTTASTCYRTTTSRAGKTTTKRRVPYSCSVRHPERWRIYVAGDDGRDRWVTVNNRVWRDCTPGDYYDGTERDC